MIRLSLWLPLELIVVCNIGGVAVCGAVQRHSSLFYVSADVQVHLQHMCILWQSANALCLVFRPEVDIPCIKAAVLLMGGEKTEQKDISLLFLLAAPMQKDLWKSYWGFLSSPPLGCQSSLTILHQRKWHVHTPTNTYTNANSTLMHNLLSPNYSRLEPMLLSLILSVWGLLGNSDISVWCLPYVGRTLLGPIKLIFNVCPTLDGPSQGWRSSRGDMICVW